MSNILKRPNVVEGFFYSDNKETLSQFVKASLSSVSGSKEGRPFALIAPFASYLYSSQAYAASYAQVMGEEYDTVIVLAPLHKMSFYGIALTESDYFTSPLGDIEIDKESNERLHRFHEDSIKYEEKYHLTEHAIEVQLPYITTALGSNVKLLPIIIGESNTRFTLLLARALKNLIETSKKRFLIVVSTNLSHNRKDEEAKEKDFAFIELLKNFNADRIAEQVALTQVEAYGSAGVITAVRLGKMLNKENVSILKYFTSGDITDETSSVEGFLSAAIYDSDETDNTEE